MHFTTTMITGHRPQALTEGEQAWARVAIATTVQRLRATHGTQVAISGMALGADTWWALAALSAGLDLHAYVPFEAQASTWPAEDQALWRELLRHAKKKVLVGEKHYDVRMLHARNDAMLKATFAEEGLVVALLKSDSRKGGTYSTVKKAQAKAQPLLILDPLTRSFTKKNW